MDANVRYCQKCKKKIIVVEVLLCEECAKGKRIDVDIEDEPTDEEPDSQN